MATVNRIPSSNLPFTNEQGIIHPVWYEYLRSFISSIETDFEGIIAGEAVVAGAGLVKSGSTLDVGAGSGIKVNADSVEVDINGQINSQAAVEDEILIVDASNGSQIRKTSLQDVANLSPGTFPGGNDTQIQYNNAGEFGGDTGFTTDGAGSVSISGDLTVDNLNFNGATIKTDSSSNPMVFNVPAGGLNQFLFAQSGAGNSAYTAEFRGTGSSARIIIRSDSNNGSTTSNAIISFATDDADPVWSAGLYDTQDDDYVLAKGTDLNVTPIYTVDRGTNNFAHNTTVSFEDTVSVGKYLLRNTTAGITASTTQTQGQGALTAEVNEVSTVANANDTVTLPTAQAGQKVWILNNGANTLQIFPASGDDLGAGLNTATTLASGSNATFIAYDATNWIQDV